MTHCHHSDIGLDDAPSDELMKFLVSLIHDDSQGCGHPAKVEAFLQKVAADHGLDYCQRCQNLFHWWPYE